MPCSTSCDRRDRGQSTVELALTLPWLCLVLLVVVQVAVVAAHRLGVQLAAREAARAAAVSADVGAPAAAANRVMAGPLDVVSLERGGLVTVSVAFTDPTDVPIIGALLPPVELRAEVTMAIEPPVGGQ